MIEKIVRPINETGKKKKKNQTITSENNCLELDFRKSSFGWPPGKSLCYTTSFFFSFFLSFFFFFFFLVWVLFYFIFFWIESSFTRNSNFIKLNYKLVYFSKYFSHGPIFDKGNVNVYSKISVKDDLLWSILNKKKGINKWNA